MFKVLIVDDELLVRNNLRTLIDWEKYGFTICGEAENGATAIKAIQRFNPHIVLIDISMPVMDGVALTQYISDHFGHIKMIILSSYDKYDYVRNTMKNGAKDYLLKHRMDGAKLLKVLKKVREEIEEEIRQKDEMERKSTVQKNLEGIAVQNYIRDLVLGLEGSTDEISNYLNSINFMIQDRKVVVVVMQVVNFTVITSQYTDREKDLLIRSISHLSQQIINEVDDVVLAYIDLGKFTFLYSFQCYYSESQMQKAILEVNNRIYNTLKRYLNVQTVFATSLPCNNSSDIPVCYERTCKLIEGKLVVDQVESEQRNNNNLSVATLTIRQEKDLLAAIEALDMVQIHGILEDIFSNVKKNNGSYYSIQMLVNELINVVNKAVYKYKLDAQLIFTDNLDRDWIKQFQNVEESKKWLREIYTRLIQALQQRDLNNRYSQYVRTAMEYIARYYNEDITLNDVAERNGITPSYLSRLFKEETGIGFQEYLNDVRVKAAQRLMENGEYKIKDIYEKVGFRSYNYFFRVFKQLTGYTPYHFIKVISKNVEK